MLLLTCSQCSHIYSYDHIDHEPSSISNTLYHIQHLTIFNNLPYLIHLITDTISLCFSVITGQFGIIIPPPPPTPPHHQHNHHHQQPPPQHHNTTTNTTARWTDIDHTLDLMDFDGSDDLDINEFFEVFRLLDAKDGKVDGILSLAAQSRNPLPPPPGR